MKAAASSSASQIPPLSASNKRNGLGGSSVSLHRQQPIQHPVVGPRSSTGSSSGDYGGTTTSTATATTTSSSSHHHHHLQHHPSSAQSTSSNSHHQSHNNHLPLHYHYGANGSASNGTTTTTMLLKPALTKTDSIDIFDCTWCVACDFLWNVCVLDFFTFFPDYTLALFFFLLFPAVVQSSLSIERVVFISSKSVYLYVFPLLLPEYSWERIIDIICPKWLLLLHECFFSIF